MSRDYRQIFAICKKHDLEYRDVVCQFTEGRTESLSALSDSELDELKRRLAKYNPPPPGNKERQKLFMLAKKMRWGKTADEINTELNKWLMKQKYGKSLQQLDVQQLGVMVAVMEQRVYPDYLTALNK